MQVDILKKILNLGKLNFGTAKVSVVVIELDE